MSPRVLVVRSGRRPFFTGEVPPGIEVLERVSHAIVPCLEGAGALEDPADLAVFTSQIAAEELLGRPDLAARFRRSLGKGEVVAVGVSTAETLASLGMPPHRVGDGSGRALLDRLPSDLSGRRVLLPRGGEASADLEEGLIRRGARVAPLVLYRKVARPRDGDMAVDIVRRPFAAFCVTAPSAARWLFEDLGAAARERLRGTPAVALGPSTRAFLLGESVSRVEVPDPADFEAAGRLLASLAVRGARA